MEGTTRWPVGYSQYQQTATMRFPMEGSWVCSFPFACKRMSGRLTPKFSKLLSANSVSVNTMTGAPTYLKEYRLYRLLSLVVQICAQCLFWALNHIHKTYVGLFGTLWYLSFGRCQNLFCCASFKPHTIIKARARKSRSRNMRSLLRTSS